ncbi:5,6-dimethylbenzimidazole synthase [Streptomyces agglomeratus]|uniref:Nicotinate-nucleotide--dimethylbenzimidazole phosphoribosyltransferase n=1 Tax=Streptomyces agglomeratus TaxID=285458 RepID=A0A1E5PE43_9ACTN|nr:nicotinate-nucleotide--dimethylbenzimidazole phosphoribosyltransferase [Streptomyces agglomeratus]OEJ27793.1 5,6-dimethylbenzimidazole synthase [Streptomyces agglomeratus]OEJ38147.1 5,6-dimethylbenzimidazole synthase [Streptomyces agglomeratus]OEJ47469.1 5,6-dimethylbenzimidazole synthase [Streptomyces agglomeratus]OEJ50674.1 5,6-dimethylbenzimidazole synthase [Streptomyces agglomeratus]OEJ58036.1 5,6-dimethylbenzimidazole synthase [Streptomyces agglomeratus]
MTDTGRVPGEGLPEDAGMVAQPGIAAPDAYTFTEPSENAAEDDDLLLMPGAQGAWSDPQVVSAPQPQIQQVPQPQHAMHAAGAPQAEPVAQAAEVSQALPQAQPEYQAAPASPAAEAAEPQPAAAPEAQSAPSGAGQVQAAQPQPQFQPQPEMGEPGAHETGGRDSGSVDLSAVRTPQPAPAVAQTPAPARRPLHLGPPMPEATGGVVRSLADRGPAAAAPGAAAMPRNPAPVRQPAPPVTGLEYLDMPSDQAAALPGPQLGTIPSQAATPWPQPQEAQAPQGNPAETVVPEAETPVPPAQVQPEPTAEPVPEQVPAPEPVAAPVAEEAVSVPAEPEPVAAAEPVAPEPVAPEPEPEPQQQEQHPVPSQEPHPVGEFVPVAGSLPTEPQLAPTPAEAPAAEPAPEPVTEPPVVAEVPEPEPQPVPEAEAVPAPPAEAAPESAEAPLPAAEPVAPVAERPAAEPAAASGEAQLTPEEALPEPAPVPEQLAEPETEPAAPAPVLVPAPRDGGPAAERPVQQQEQEAAPAEPEAAPEPEAIPEPPAAATAPEPAPVVPDAEPAPVVPDAGPAPVVAEPGPAAVVPESAPAPGYDDAEREAVLRVMRERRDIRNGFRSDPIPHEVLLRVLEAAHTAPSVGHSQPWDFVVIRSAETRRTMHELAVRQRDAYAKSLPKGRAKQFKELKIEAILDTPVNIVVTADPTRGGRHTLGRHTQPQMAPYSSALAVENLWLAARAEGLGVGWVSFFDEREMVRALGLPEHLEVVAYLCVGYVDEFPEEPELMQAGWSKRRPLSWVVHEETYGRRALPGEEPHDLLQETVSTIRPLDAKALGEAWERQKRMTKPAGALGMLEIISAQLSGLSRMCPPPIPEPAAVAIFAGDHGVHAQGVTAWPQEVTSQMVANILGGGAVCNAFASQVGAEVCVVDVGVAGELPATPGLLPRKVRAGTADFTTGQALTHEEVLAAIEVGIETARDLVAAGNKALITGEMGIANTTVSAALIAVYTGQDPAEITGRGTGINDEMHARKVDVVRRALELHHPDPADPIGVLAAVGGLEHAALVGFLLGGASLRTPVILDGVSAGAAALVARAIAPESLAACIAGHRSAEPGHVAALNKLGLRPLVDLDLRLGEGTGALLALPVVQSAARAMHEVATFDSAGVTEK